MYFKQINNEGLTSEPLYFKRFDPTSNEVFIFSISEIVEYIKKKPEIKFYVFNHGKYYRLKYM